MKILIVDDNKENLYLLEALLKGSGYEVTSAVNGKEALEKLRTQSFDMVISDILMPVMDGFQLCREVKVDSELKDIQFVFYTATYTDEKDEEFALKIGATKFIRKPMEPDEFMKIIKEVIKDVEKGKIEPKKPALEKEEEVFKLYSERLVNKLEKKMLDLEKEVTERKRVMERAEHLKFVLSTIRSVNQLIIRERDRDRLIQGACRNFIKIRGFYSAWIALIDESRSLVSVAEAGLGKAFQPILKNLKRGEFPNCMRRALAKPGVLTIEDSASTCANCPLANKFQENGILSSRLEHDGKIYGILTVSLPVDYISGKEELHLFKEITDDIAYALNHIELEEKRKRAEEELKSSEERLNILFEYAPYGYYLNDLKGNLIDGNIAAEELTGYKREELIGKNLLKLKLLSPKQIPKAAVLLAKSALRQPTGPDELILNRKDGNPVTVEIRTFPVKIKGETFVLANVVDITKRKKAEEALQKAHEELEIKIEKRTDELRQAVANLKEEVTERKQAEKGLAESMQAVEAANRAKSDFLANMSHELRTPLNSIIGFSEVMVDGIPGPVTDEQKEYLNDVLESGRHLLALINDILDLSKVEAGKLELEVNEFSIKDLLERSIIMFKEKAAKHHIVLKSEIHEDIGNIIADERKTKQVVFNLLSNAVKFTPDRGSVGITAHRTDKEVQITVWDTGIGIAEEDKDRIFQPFQQLESTLTKKPEGTGLGLNLTKELVELQGGRIWLESKLGKGSKFHFMIPIRGDDDKGTNRRRQ